MKELQDIFEIATGVVASRKEAVPGSTAIAYKYLTLKSFNSNGYIDSLLLDKFESAEAIDSKYLTNVGDVVIRLSDPFTAVCIDKNQEGILVSSIFAILRPRGGNFSSEFISLYLNSDFMKKQYKRDAGGSALQTIKVASLKNYKVNFPDIENQKIAVEFNRLMIKEEELLERLLENKKVYYNAILNSIIDGGKKNGK